MGIPDPLLASWDICMHVKKQQLELGMEQIEKGVSQVCILSPCLFNLYAEYILWNAGLYEVQAGFRKHRGSKDQITNIRWIIEKAREFQKNIYFYFTDYIKAFDNVDHSKL